MTLTIHSKNMNRFLRKRHLSHLNVSNAHKHLILIAILFYFFPFQKERSTNMIPHLMGSLGSHSPRLTLSPQDLILWVPQEDLTWAILLITLQCCTQGWPVTGVKGRWLEHVSSAPFAPIMTCAPHARAKASTRSMLSCPYFTPWPTCLRWMPVLLLLCLCIVLHIIHFGFQITWTYWFK